VVFVTAGSGCDDPGDTKPDPPGTTNPIPAKVRAETLLDDLSQGKGVKLDHEYASSQLVLGTKGDTAIAYYCDPKTGLIWLGGSNDVNQLQLVAPNGAGFVGSIIGSTAQGKISGTNAFDGNVTLPATNNATIEQVAASGKCP
jgi:hypothetical protein